MNKTELIRAFAEFTKDEPDAAKATVNKLFSFLHAVLIKGEEVSLPYLGKLKVSTRPQRNGRNPSSGEILVIAPKRVVKFHPSAEFEEELQN